MDEPTSYRLPPIPLVSGDSLVRDDGATEQIAAVQVVVTGVSGTRRTIDLRPELGGWWPPDDA